MCCIYKHPTPSNQGFIDSYILPILEKLSYEKKQVMLKGDFNMDLLNYNTNRRITRFVDEMWTDSFISYTNLPNRTTNQSVVIDNIYNKINSQPTAGIIITSISDHLMQFLIEKLPFTSNSKQTTKTWCCYKSFDKKHIPPKHWNTGLVSSGVSLTSWWDGDSLALFGYLSSDSITIEISYVVDALLYQWTSHPIFSYFIHENWMRIYC